MRHFFLCPRSILEETPWAPGGRITTGHGPMNGGKTLHKRKLGLDGENGFQPKVASCLGTGQVTDVSRWAHLVCDAPSVTGVEVGRTRSRQREWMDTRVRWIFFALFLTIVRRASWSVATMRFPCALVPCSIAEGKWRDGVAPTQVAVGEFFWPAAASRQRGKPVPRGLGIPSLQPVWPPEQVGVASFHVSNAAVTVLCHS